jgi:hypothetical protein
MPRILRGPFQLDASGLARSSLSTIRTARFPIRLMATLARRQSAEWISDASSVRENAQPLDPGCSGLDRTAQPQIAGGT